LFAASVGRNKRKRIAPSKEATLLNGAMRCASYWLPLWTSNEFLPSLCASHYVLEIARYPDAAQRAALRGVARC
jgi:hypothetical protein